MTLHPTDFEGHPGFLVTCNGCGRELESSNDDGDYLVIVEGDDPEDEISAFGWERWEDGKDRCPGCMDAVIALDEPVKTPIDRKGPNATGQER